MHSHAMDAKLMSKLIYCLLQRNQYPTIYQTNFGLALDQFPMNLFFIMYKAVRQTD